MSKGGCSLIMVQWIWGWLCEFTLGLVAKIAGAEAEAWCRRFFQKMTRTTIAVGALDISYGAIVIFISHYFTFESGMVLFLGVTFIRWVLSQMISGNGLLQQQTSEVKKNLSYQTFKPPITMTSFIKIGVPDLEADKFQKLLQFISDLILDYEDWESEMTKEEENCTVIEAVARERFLDRGGSK